MFPANPRGMARTKPGPPIADMEFLDSLQVVNVADIDNARVSGWRTNEQSFNHYRHGKLPCFCPPRIKTGGVLRSSAAEGRICVVCKENGGTFALALCRRGEGAAPFAPDGSRHGVREGAVHHCPPPGAQRTLAGTMGRFLPRGPAVREGRGGCEPPHRERGTAPFPARTEPRPPRAPHKFFRVWKNLFRGANNAEAPTVAAGRGIVLPEGGGGGRMERVLGAMEKGSCI